MTPEVKGANNMPAYETVAYYQRQIANGNIDPNGNEVQSLQGTIEAATVKSLRGQIYRARRSQPNISTHLAYFPTFRKFTQGLSIIALTLTTLAGIGVVARELMNEPATKTNQPASLEEKYAELMNDLFNEGCEGSYIDAELFYNLLGRGYSIKNGNITVDLENGGSAYLIPIGLDGEESTKEDPEVTIACAIPINNPTE